MAQHDTTYRQLLTDALTLLGDMQQRMGMFENQDYWKLKLKAEEVKKLDERSNPSVFAENLSQ